MDTDQCIQRLIRSEPEGSVCCEVCLRYFYQKPAHNSGLQHSCLRQQLIKSVTRVSLTNIKGSVMYVCDCHVLLRDDKCDVTWLLVLDWTYAEF